MASLRLAKPAKQSLMLAIEGTGFSFLICFTELKNSQVRFVELFHLFLLTLGLAPARILFKLS